MLIVDWSVENMNPQRDLIRDVVTC